MKTHLKIRGFSLVELMIGVVILSILMSIALPSLQSWPLDARVRNAAETILTGLQRARAEAVSRNTNISFTFTGADSSWAVTDVATKAIIESKSANDGSKDVTIGAKPALAQTVTYNSLGTIGVPANIPNNADGSPPLSQIDLSIHKGTKPLRITIDQSGKARMCDPALIKTQSASACN